MEISILKYPQPNKGFKLMSISESVIIVVGCIKKYTTDFVQILKNSVCTGSYYKRVFLTPFFCRELKSQRNKSQDVGPFNLLSFNVENTTSQ